MQNGECGVRNGEPSRLRGSGPPEFCPPAFRHSPFPTPHSAFRIPHSKGLRQGLTVRFPHSAFLIPIPHSHSAFPIPHSAFKWSRQKLQNGTRPHSTAPSILKAPICYPLNF